MKKIDSSKSIYFPSVHLYREELDSIIEVLTKVSDDISISDSNFSYESIDELKKERGIMVSDLEINSSNPYISLRFKRNNDFNSIYLYIGSTDEKHIYALNQISEILNNNRSKLSYVFTPIIGYYIPALLFSFSWVWVTTINNLLNNKVSLAAVLILLVALPASTYLIQGGKIFTICLSKRHQVSNFFGRQKDDLIKILLGCLLGAAITYFIGEIS